MNKNFDKILSILVRVITIMLRQGNISQKHFFIQLQTSSSSPPSTCCSWPTQSGYLCIESNLYWCSSLRTWLLLKMKRLSGKLERQEIFPRNILWNWNIRILCYLIKTEPLEAVLIFIDEMSFIDLYRHFYKLLHRFVLDFTFYFDPFWIFCE